MKPGNLDISIVSGGRFWIDGGGMFGVVPRVLWERVFPPDEKHRIPQETNCLLVRDGERNILIDTGYGPKLPDKQRRNFGAQDGEPLIENLAARGLTREDIDVIIFSHLHFDHAGGATRYDEDGSLIPAFPNAEYVAQRREWVIATADYPELRGAYPQENLLPLRESGQLRLIDGDVEIVPGIRSQVTGGHTDGHQVLIVESENDSAVFLGDICSTSRHLPILWCLAFDVHMQQTRRAKAAVLEQIVQTNAIAVFDHDPDIGAARLKPDDRRDYAIAEDLRFL
ncbi:MAG: MBL fold metallo-hydrolase [Planctomycetota bacterium]|jgi:glyoxylase-like metal-dependent hydrolase (beta-lactamase superfamily II)